MYQPKMAFAKAATCNNVAESSLPWTERYRARKVTDVRGQASMQALAAGVLKRNGALPNLILHGPSGTGKTSSILALCRDLFGPDPDVLGERVLFLNASADNGIQVVRDKIKPFAARSVGMGAPGYPSPPIKVVVLDEADCLTPDAQASLRRLIENTSANTRFCFVCNFVSKIIAPIASRCHKYYFTPVPDEDVLQRLTEIAAAEDITAGLESLPDVVKYAQGDLRKAINVLQTCRTESCLDRNVFLDITGAVSATEVNTLVHEAADDVLAAAQHIETMISRGGHPVQIVEEILRLLMEPGPNDSISVDVAVDAAAVEAVKAVAKQAMALTRPCDEVIAVLAAALAAAPVV